MKKLLLIIVPLLLASGCAYSVYPSVANQQVIQEGLNTRAVLEANSDQNARTDKMIQTMVGKAGITQTKTKGGDTVFAVMPMPDSAVIKAANEGRVQLKIERKKNLADVLIHTVDAVEGVLTNPLTVMGATAGYIAGTAVKNAGAVINNNGRGSYAEYNKDSVSRSTTGDIRIKSEETSDSFNKTTTKTDTNTNTETTTTGGGT